MGGPVPLGYDVENRKLVVNDSEASLVRHIMQRYLQLASVNALADELNAQGYRTKLQRRTSGPHRGGCSFRRGTLYHLLSNRSEEHTSELQSLMRLSYAVFCLTPKKTSIYQ